MKYIQVFIVALFFTNNLSAQTGYKIIYEAITFNADANYFEKWDRKFVTVFNDSFFYSYSYTGKKDRMKNAAYYGAKTENHDRAYSVAAAQWYHVTKLINNKKPFLKVNNFPKTEWRIQPDSTKLILGYHCTKAWSLYNGIMQYVWFTNEIPFTYGIIDGINYPGAVIELYEAKREVFYRAVEIEKGDYKIVLPNYPIKEEEEL